MKTGIEEYEFEACVAAIVRVRWFFLIVVLLCGSLAGHLYSERASFEEHQLTQVAGARLKFMVTEKQEDRERLLGAISKNLDKHFDEKDLAAILHKPDGKRVEFLQEDLFKSFKEYQANTDEGDICDRPCPENSDPQQQNSSTCIEKLYECNGVKCVVSMPVFTSCIDKYSESDYKIRRTDNMLNKVTTGNRVLPLLGLDVFANDYVPMLSLMLAVFSVALWLNLRSVYSILSSIAPDERLRRLIRFNFTFTTSPDSRWAEAVQYLAIWLPSGLAAVTVIVDLWPPLRDGFRDPTIVIGEGKSVIVRVLILLISSAVIVLCSRANAQLTNACDSIVNR